MGLVLSLKRIKCETSPYPMYEDTKKVEPYQTKFGIALTFGFITFKLREINFCF